MLTTSLDTLLACSIMVVLALSSMVSVLTIVHPYLQNQSSRHETETSHRLAEYMLLEPGDPSNWGSDASASLVSFGLAKANITTPFELDIDKVTRLNQENAYNESFPDVFTALGVQDKPFRIKIEPFFDVSLDLTSQTEEGSQTVYRFQVCTNRSNLPIAASLSCYIVLGDYVDNTTSSTSSSGVGSLEVALPNSLNGTALLAAIARVDSRTMSYSVFAFKHHSAGYPHQRGTFARLSPLNHTLRAELSYSDEEILGAKVFTYDYYFNLTRIDESPSIKNYSIPHLLDASPMILVVMGLNQSTSFAAWVAYPQVPLDFGSDFTRQHDVMDSFSFHFLVSINLALYECEIILGGT